MHIVVIGANGRTGRLVVEQAVGAGHRVTAVCRSAPGDLAVEAEILHADVVRDDGFTLPSGTDLVISTLGKKSNRDRTPVCADGMKHVIAAMRRAGARRLIAASASPVLRTATGEPVWFRATVRPLVRWTGRRLYADLEQMEATLRSSADDIDWSVVRPGYLVDRPGGAYELVQGANAMGVVHRADLASALLAVADHPDAAGAAYGLASRPKDRS
ncbi:NAD(P)-dependent oxidoreductase [Agromyces sp. CCNWLW203]|uniref:NAD(P)-dependent oxidoreductase n=1 Tax=Agromyces sp. CCNWLW203 TaxID=3112842 RepID=UPI002F96BCAB